MFTPMTESLDERLTFVLPYQFAGRRRYLLARMEFDLVEGELVSDEAGSIISFDTADAAQAHAARLFPDNDGDSDEAREIATIRRGLQEMYGSAVVPYDLDAVATWVERPETDPPSPVALREAWRLLAWMGLAPEPVQFDPMGFAGLHMGRAPGGALTEAEGLIATSMKLDGMVRETERRVGRGEAVDDDWDQYREMWSAEDGQRLAGVLRAGLDSFPARVKD
jgi:hypothetical protein